MALLWAFTSTQARQNSSWANTGPMMLLIYSSRCSRILKVPIVSSRKGFDSILMITLAMLPFTARDVLHTPIDYDALVKSSYLHNFMMMIMITYTASIGLLHNHNIAYLLTSR